MKYIVITGGVLSGLGKGITASSIGRLLKSRGYKVTAIKIDPYINCDAGTLRPTEHGEVWVTEDGGEIDQDLGHYERFLDINIPKYQNITTGQVYSAVIEKERKGKYLGKTVNAIKVFVRLPKEVGLVREYLKAIKGIRSIEEYDISFCNLIKASRPITYCVIIYYGIILYVFTQF